METISYGICLQTCNIKLKPEIMNKTGILNAGSLFKIPCMFNNSGTGEVDIHRLRYDKYDIIFENATHICNLNNFKAIDYTLFLLLVAVKPENRLDLIRDEDLIKFIRNIQMNQPVLIPSTSFRGRVNDLACAVKYIGRAPQIGVGIFFGFVITDPLDSIQVQGSLAKKYLECDDSKGFLRAADVFYKRKQYPHIGMQSYPSVSSIGAFGSMESFPGTIKEDTRYNQNDAHQYKSSNRKMGMPIYANKTPIFRPNYYDCTIRKNLNIFKNRFKATCTKCRQPVDTSQGIYLVPCEHVFCMNCMRSHIHSTATPIKTCPVENCNQKLSENEIKMFMSPTEFSWHLRLLKQSDKLQNKITFTPFVPLTPVQQIELKPEIIDMTKPLEPKLPHAANHYHELLDNKQIITNFAPFECPICFKTFTNNSDGIVLRDCLHLFCRDCLTDIIKLADEPEIKCPYINNNYSCDSLIQEHDIKSLVTIDMYENHLLKSIRHVEHKIENAVDCCETPNCRGLGMDNELKFNFGQITNCLRCHCQAIHDGLDCKDYQEALNSGRDSKIQTKLSMDILQDMVDKCEAMNCSASQIILMNNDEEANG